MNMEKIVENQNESLNNLSSMQFEQKQYKNRQILELSDEDNESNESLEIEDQPWV